LNLEVLSVGRDKGPTLELAEEYARRLQRFTKVQLLELKEVDLSRAHGELWMLDRLGAQLTSEELAARVGRTAQISLCIGPDEGFSDDERKKARFLWSLGKGTLPHRLARVIALEQMYRAFEILRGGPYHK